jgi:hypothetical protein
MRQLFCLLFSLNTASKSLQLEFFHARLKYFRGLRKRF